MTATATKPVNRLSAGMAYENSRERRRAAAKHPSMREFDRMIADLMLIGKRIEAFLDANDVAETTETVLMLDTVMGRGEESDENSSYVAFETLRALKWAIENGVSFVTSNLPTWELRHIRAAEEEIRRMGKDS